ncbi:MAG: hypothetical protein IIW61_03900 [Bacteroidaceae bacterium]|nr:hypothetical protein [Bacteroidaceae bacterium]
MFKRFYIPVILLCMLLAGCRSAQSGNEAAREGVVTVAVFSINDFHASFVPDARKGIPGAAAVWQTLDSLKAVYPYHLTLSAGDNFGGSYFYKATKGCVMPVFFNGLGIRISALGNHEFDDGQAALADKWQSTGMRPERLEHRLCVCQRADCRRGHSRLRSTMDHGGNSHRQQETHGGHCRTFDFKHAQADKPFAHCRPHF